MDNITTLKEERDGLLIMLGDLQWANDALEEEVVRLRSEIAQMAGPAGQVETLEREVSWLQFERGQLKEQVGELEGRFTLDDLNAAYERLRANMIRWGVDTGTLWALAGLHEDLSRILAGEWTEDAPVAALDNVEPAGDVAPF